MCWGSPNYGGGCGSLDFTGVIPPPCNVQNAYGKSCLRCICRPGQIGTSNLTYVSNEAFDGLCRACGIGKYNDIESDSRRNCPYYTYQTSTGSVACTTVAKWPIVVVAAVLVIIWFTTAVGLFLQQKGRHGRRGVLLRYRDLDRSLRFSFWKEVISFFFESYTFIGLSVTALEGIHGDRMPAFIRYLASVLRTAF